MSLSFICHSSRAGMEYVNNLKDGVDDGLSLKRSERQASKEEASPLLNLWIL